VATQALQVLVMLFVISGNASGFATCTQVFTGVKAKASNIAKAPNILAFVFCALCLCGIFY
jgi:preprotein translocase subunit SecG